MGKRNLISIENGKRVLVLSGVRRFNDRNSILLDNESIMFLAGMNCSYEDLTEVEKMNFNICRKGETQSYFDPHIGYSPVYAIVNGVKTDVTKYTDGEIEHLKSLYPDLLGDDLNEFLDEASMLLNDNLFLNGERFYHYEMRLETDIRRDEKYYGGLQEFLENDFNGDEFDEVRFVVVNQF